MVFSCSKQSLRCWDLCQKPVKDPPQLLLMGAGLYLATVPRLEVGRGSDNCARCKHTKSYSLMGTLLKALSSHSTLCPIQSALRLSSEGGRGEHMFRLSGFSEACICSCQFIEQSRDPGILPKRQHHRCAPSSSPTVFSAHKLVKLYQNSVQSCCPKNINCNFHM